MWIFFMCKKVVIILCGCQGIVAGFMHVPWGCQVILVSPGWGHASKSLWSCWKNYRIFSISIINQQLFTIKTRSYTKNYMLCFRFYSWACEFWWCSVSIPPVERNTLPVWSTDTIIVPITTVKSIRISLVLSIVSSTEVKLARGYRGLMDINLNSCCSKFSL